MSKVTAGYRAVLILARAPSSLIQPVSPKEWNCCWATS